MFVITADQVGSRSSVDLVDSAVRAINAGPANTVMEAARTVGDELQVLTAHGSDALGIILQLHRVGQWSIGCGIGAIATPLPTDIRAASGDAFIAARTAVERAKKRSTRVAIEREPSPHGARDAEALLDLLLILRSRRTPEGWELADLLDHGITQAEAAARLDISPQAVSLRARAADLRADAAARPALERILEGLGSLEPTIEGGQA